MRKFLGLVTLSLTALILPAQVTYDRILNADKEPRNWLTYNGTYASHHHSALDTITPENVGKLEMTWVFQVRSLEKFQTTPLVVDGVMYLTEAPNNVIAVDAKTGRIFWMYEHDLASPVSPCCGRVNRGVAILGNKLFLATLDARLIALDAKTGSKLWDTRVANYRSGYTLALSPLVVKDKVIIGTAGGEFGIKGFLAAYDAETGKQVWKFNTIPGPGEPGHDTWENDAWKTGGGSIWLTGSYDPELNLTYWGVGNPSPDWNPDVRPGDNLYTDSVVALDPDTGELKWHFQFTPHDEWDWDSVQVPVLLDAEWEGAQRKLMLWANRNAFYYILDRATGEFLHGNAFVKQDWTIGLDEAGRPIKAPGRGPSEEGTETFPGVQGGTNWFAPAYNPSTNLFYLSVWENYASTYFKDAAEYSPGNRFTGGRVKQGFPAISRSRIHVRDKDTGYGAIRALNPLTGEKVWEYATPDVSDSGLLSTGSDVLFSGSREGSFYALDAKSGKLLWKRYLGGQIVASPITYSIDGVQYVSVASGSSLFSFTLHE